MSEVYPQPQVSPLSLGAGVSSSLVSIAELTGPDLVPNTMFIRIVMLGAAGTNPTVALQADSGTPVDVTATTPPGNNIYDGVNPTEAASGIITGPDANNVYLLKVFIYNPGRTWKIRITNNDAGPREFTWVVGDSDTDSQHPWIDVTPATLDYDVLVNENPTNTARDLQVANKGTGPLTLTGTNPALGPDFTLSALPGSINPNSSSSLQVTFNAPSAPPAPDGITTATSSITSGDSLAGTTGGHNKQFVLTAITRELEAMILLDASGSMSWHADGTSGKPPSRWSELASATNLFLDLLAAFGANKGKFGIARFPASDPTNPSTYDIVSPTTITGPGTMGPHQTAVSAVAPFGGTPMGDGLDHILAPATSYFSADPTDVDVNRRWLLLMSDGAHNSGTVAPRSFVPTSVDSGTAASGASLQDKKIKLFAVGYGIPGAADVDMTLLSDLAAGSLDGGDTEQVNVDSNTAADLADAFKSAIKAGLIPAIAAPADPGGVLHPDAAEARHQIIVTPYDTKVAFILYWNTPDTERMTLELLSPNCDLITPESASGDYGQPGISFSDDLRYQMYTIDHDYLRNASDPSRPRYGTWTLIISSKLGEGDSESYTYDAMVESRLRMDVRFDRGTYYAGDPIGLSATLTVDGKPITNASVSVSTTAPGASVYNWLAAAKVSDEEYQKAAETLSGQDVNPLFIKAYAARLKGITLDVFTRSDTIAMTDPSNQGVYEATIRQTSIPESYTFYVTATGQTEDGVLFRREKQLQVHVGVRPDPDFTWFDIGYVQIFEDEVPFYLAKVQVWPRDRFGNIVLIDPETNPTVQLTAEGGEFIGPLVGNLDGSYTRSLRYSPEINPVIGLQVGGQEIISKREIAPVAQLRYAEQVLDFKPGNEAEKGANQHRDPQAVLGDVTTKKPEEFVSLGGLGSLTVGIADQVILAQGDDDVTVFVQPDEDMRPYLVEALPVVGRVNWVELGTSPGTTQSFGLGQAGLKAAQAIRITDKSGRTRDREFKPISTPGVSIRGVGFKKVGPKGCLELLLGIIRLFGPQTNRRVEKDAPL